MFGVGDLRARLIKERAIVMGRMNSLGRAVVRRFTRIRARRQLAALQAETGPLGRVASAVDRAVVGSYSGEEKSWIERIEAIRARLEADMSEVSIVDYGAGSAGDQRTEQEMTDGVVIQKRLTDVCNANKPPFWASILFNIVREFKPESGLEMGTCLGISASYQGAAMELNGRGSLVTLEGAESLAEASRETLSSCHLDSRVTVITGRFGETLGETLRIHGPLDYAFIDGHHDERATVDYFKQLLPHVSETSILLFDDISWTPGMRRAWETISASDVVRVAVDLGAIGICVLDPSVPKRDSVKISLRGL